MQNESDNFQEHFDAISAAARAAHPRMQEVISAQFAAEVAIDRAFASLMTRPSVAENVPHRHKITVIRACLTDSIADGCLDFLVQLSELRNSIAHLRAAHSIDALYDRFVRESRAYFDRIDPEVNSRGDREHPELMLKIELWLYRHCAIVQGCAIAERRLRGR